MEHETKDIEGGRASGEVHSEEEAAMEKTFEDTAVPSWGKQITIRSLVTSLLLSLVFNVIVCKLNLTTGVIPSLNVAAGLIGFALVRSWTALAEKCGLLKQPFTRQENTVIQTCIVASSGIAFSSGTGSYLLAMTPKIAAAGTAAVNVKELSVGWMIGYLFVVSFVGLFSIVPLRKVMILKYKLSYPSGTATAYLINSFHTPKGAKLAKKQVMCLFKSFVGSFMFACFKWFFTAGDGCGFDSFPTFGLQALKQRFNFDFSTTYVGVGMICPYMVNVSLLLGAILSWGVMWPLIQTKEGIWYDSGLKGSDIHGIQGYRVFIAISMMLGDGLFHAVYMVIVSVKNFMAQQSQQRHVNDAMEEEQPSGDYDEKKRKEYFLKDQIPNAAAITGYILLAALSVGLIPVIFHQLKWYHILVAYIVAPVLAFCNAYGCGLTDWSLASNYGKLAILIFSSWVGLDHGGIIAGLASCGVMMSIVSTASDLMQDFKTGYLTLSSPRSMFFGQVYGTALGCIMSPLVFWFFYKAYDVGGQNSSYPAPFANMYRAIAKLGVEGFSALPKHCLTLMIVFFVSAVVINLLIEIMKKCDIKIYKFIPSPMCMAIPFYLGAYFAIDMCVGSFILFVWERQRKKSAKEYGPAVASGLICGDSLWGIPGAILALSGVNSPMCMKFLSYSVNTKVDGFLNG
ncbi:putative metal-nicotianamine transporter YSL12 [Primulina tabacum]|uniref:putative metal-nicotianamine transporter YSL12 n=1 Tax=Primulina tabacum TaxID=48773 RepID=UPI003F5A5282